MEHRLGHAELSSYVVSPTPPERRPSQEELQAQIHAQKAQFQAMHNVHTLELGQQRRENERLRNFVCPPPPSLPPCLRPSSLLFLFVSAL